MRQAPAYPDHSAALAALVGQRSGPADLSPHPVNQPMIRHWVEAMGDENPVYESDEAARAAGLERSIAPPSMLQAWIMQGLRATLAREAARASGAPPGDSPNERMMALLDEEGMTSVVATNCDQTYGRPLVVGDRLVVASVIESISDVKTTGLGTGRFVTTRLDFVAVPDAQVGSGAVAESLMALGDPVAVMRFRILKFRPRAVAEPGPDAPAERPLRPRPALTQDNSFWFEGTRGHQLLIQRCTSCGRLRHPPLPACARCRSFEWDTVAASGRGELYSYVVVHHPEVAAFDYPLPIGLVALEEGTRLVANLDGVAPGDLRIGMPVVAEFVDFDGELSLPVFRPDTTRGS